MLRDGLIAADVDGDGVLDLLCAYGINDSSGKGQYAQVVLSVSFGRATAGRGDGTFEPSVLLPQLVDTHRFIVEDFNQDGRADVAFAVNGYDPSISGYRYEVRKMLGSGNRSAPFGQPVIHALPATSDTNFVLAGDFNADGAIDLMTDKHNSLLLGTAVNGTPTGDFSPSTPVRVDSILPMGVRKASVVEDYDQDGALDIIMSYGSYPGRIDLVRRWVGAPGVRFVTHVSYPTQTRHQYGLVVRDFNEDGAPDIAFGSPGVTIMLGRAAPGLTASP
jgi:hypothetical protein